MRLALDGLGIGKGRLSDHQGKLWPRRPLPLAQLHTRLQRLHGGAINDRCSQADPIVDANSTEPLEQQARHSREAVDGERNHQHGPAEERGPGRRGRADRVRPRRGLAAAAAVFDTIQAAERRAPWQRGLQGHGRLLRRRDPSKLDDQRPARGRSTRLETVVSSASGAKVRRTISPQRPPGACSRSPSWCSWPWPRPTAPCSPGTDNAAKKLRITKEEYRAFLTRDGRRRHLRGPSSARRRRRRARRPALRRRRHKQRRDARRLGDQARQPDRRGDACGSWRATPTATGCSPRKSSPTGSRSYGDLQPRGGTQRASPEQLRRIRETAALAAVAAYDVERDGRLTLEEMRVYSSDFTRRSMGQTMVRLIRCSVFYFPLGASCFFFRANRRPHDTRESAYPRGRSRSHLAADRVEGRSRPPRPLPSSKEKGQQQEQQQEEQAPRRGLPVAAYPAPHQRLGPRPTSPPSSTSSPSFDDSAALRSFMLSHANFSMSARAALAAAPPQGCPIASGSAADLAPGFDVWSRGPDPSNSPRRSGLTFIATVHRRGRGRTGRSGRGPGPGPWRQSAAVREREREFCFSSIFLLSSDFSPLKFFARETHSSSFSLSLPL